MTTVLFTQSANGPLAFKDTSMPAPPFARHLLAAAAIVVSAAACSSAFAREVQLVVFQIGTASGDDERQAKADAYDQAVMALNNTCFGELDRIVKTAENCIRSEDQHTCVTSVKGMCTIRKK